MNSKLEKINSSWDFKSNYLIDTLSKESREKLFKDSFIETFKKGEIVARRNHHPEFLYYIKKGSVKRFAKDNHGKEYIIQILRENLLFGYHSILSEERFTTYTESLEDSIIVLIPKEVFIEFLKSNPQFQLHLLKILSYEFSIMINYISNYVNKPIINRVITQLLIQANYFVSHNPGIKDEINFHLKREDLAGLVGASRENIILALNKLKKLGFISCKGSIIKILQIDKLINYENDL